MSRSEEQEVRPEVVIDWSEEAISAFDVMDAEFVVVSRDSADVKFYTPLCGLLARVHKAFGIEAIFVTEWCGGEPLMRPAADDDGTDADLLQSTYGSRLLHEDRAKTAQAFEAFPVITHDGLEHGTLCCTHAPAADEVAERSRRGAMRSVARLIADWFENQELSFSGFGPLRGNSMLAELQPA